MPPFVRDFEAEISDREDHGREASETRGQLVLPVAGTRSDLHARYEGAGTIADTRSRRSENPRHSSGKRPPSQLPFSTSGVSMREADFRERVVRNLWNGRPLDEQEAPGRRQCPDPEIQAQLKALRWLTDIAQPTLTVALRELIAQGAVPNGRLAYG